jgi:allophanate hydrolase subunit 2
LGPDGPTIGGYPKIAVVIDADLDRVGQLRPSDAVRFKAVEVETALEVRRQRAERIERATAMLRLASG